MNVLVVSHLYPRAANPTSGTFVHEQARALRARGHDVRVVSPVAFAPPFLPRYRAHRATPRRGERDGIPVTFPRRLVLPNAMLGARNARMFAHVLARALSGMYGAWKPDVLHAHTIAPDGWAAARVGARHGIPVVATAHGADVRELPARGDRERLVVRDALANVDRVVAVSEAIRLLAAAVGPTRAPVSVIPNGADLERFRPRPVEEARQALGLPGGPLVVYVGQLKRVKGVDVLARAIGQTADDPDGPAFAIVGSGPLEGSLRSAVTEAGASDRVTFVGDVAHDVVPLWLAAADLVVLPSRAEGLPTVACETLASGRPIVATAVGGTPEVVADGVTGVLVPSEDARALAGALLALLRDPDLRRRMGVAARRHAEAEFSWARNAERVEGVFQNLVARAPASS